MSTEVDPKPEAVESLTNGESVDAATTEAYQKVARQIEFYFSDANLPSDKFLFTTSQNSLAAEEKQKKMGQGWVALTTLLSFNRMKRFQSLGLAKVAAAIKKYSNDLLEVDSYGTKVRRTRPLVQIPYAEVMDRTLYIKGFPQEEGSPAGALQESIEDFLAQYGLLDVVRMRREGGTEPLKQGERRPFKGSVFVEFRHKDKAQAFLDQEPKPTFPGQSEPLIAMKKKEYLDKKQAERGSDFKDDDKPKGTDHRKFNAFREMRTKDRGSPNKRSSGKAVDDGPVSVSYEGKKYEVNRDGTLVDPASLEYRKDAVLAFEGVGSGDFDFKSIKKPLFEIQAPTYVKREDGASSGVVGFRDTITDEKIAEIEKREIKAGGSDEPLKWRRLTEEEEKAYHVERVGFFASQEANPEEDKRSSHRNSRGKGRNDRGRGGRRGERSNKRSRDDDEAEEPFLKKDRDAAAAADAEESANKKLKSEDVAEKSGPTDAKRERDEQEGDDDKVVKKAKTEEVKVQS